MGNNHVDTQMNNDMNKNDSSNTKKSHTVFRQIRCPSASTLVLWPAFIFVGHCVVVVNFN